MVKEMAGPDMVELALRQKELARSREVLTELVNGPPLYEGVVKEAAQSGEVILAEVKTCCHQAFDPQGAPLTVRGDVGKDWQLLLHFFSRLGHGSSR